MSLNVTLSTNETTYYPKSDTSMNCNIMKYSEEAYDPPIMVIKRVLRHMRIIHILTFDVHIYYLNS